MRHTGFSVVVTSERSDSFYEQVLTDMLDAGVDAIELQLPEHDERMLEGRLSELVREFGYRAIHSSQLVSLEESREDIAYYQRALQVLNAQSLTVHPDKMRSRGWLVNAFGGLAQPENMDARHDFATLPQHMATICQDLPDAKITLDINHIFSLGDPDMITNAVYDFHGPCAPAIGLYHFSGYEGLGEGQRPHTGLDEAPTEQIEEMFKCLMHPDVPLILETRGWRDLDQWRADYDITRSYLA